MDRQDFHTLMGIADENMYQEKRAWENSQTEEGEYPSLSENFLSIINNKM